MCAECFVEPLLLHQGCLPAGLPAWHNGLSWMLTLSHVAIVMLQQHINNLTLLAMNRPPQAHTKNLLQKLRDNIPGLALRTTFISGRRLPSCAVVMLSGCCFHVTKLMAAGIYCGSRGCCVASD